MRYNYSSPTQIRVKRIINPNKHHSRVSIGRSNQFLDYLIDPSFQGANRLSVLSFGNNNHRTRYKRCFLSTVQIKDDDFMIAGQNFFDQPVKIDLRTYDNIVY